MCIALHFAMITFIENEKGTFYLAFHCQNLVRNQTLIMIVM